MMIFFYKCIYMIHSYVKVYCVYITFLLSRAGFTNLLTYPRICKSLTKQLLLPSEIDT